MGRSCSRMALLLVPAVILLLFTGSARRMVGAEGLEGHVAGDPNQGQGKSSREMVELDYVYAGPNVNSKSGYLVPPAPPPHQSSRPPH